MKCEDFYDVDDPRSYSYIRNNIRQKINYYYLLINIFLSIIYFLSIIIILKYFNGFNKKIFNILFIVIYGIFEIKYLFLFLIKIYQILAPDYIRNKCRFEPNCSNYMIISIQKYGFISGFVKGLKRLKRCNISDGGYDKP